MRASPAARRRRALVLGEMPDDPEAWSPVAGHVMPLDPDRWAEYLRDDTAIALLMVTTRLGIETKRGDRWTFP